MVTSTASRIPVWLLDVDGVLNANRPGWHERPHSAIAYAAGEPFKMRWSPTLLGKIRDILAAGQVELRWCTTWCDWADQLEQLFGLPDLPRAISLPAGGSGRRWQAAKLEAALGVIREGRPLVWTDDEAIPTQGAGRIRLRHTSVPTCLIAPAPNRGLQPEHIVQIELFIDENQR